MIGKICVLIFIVATAASLETINFQGKEYIHKTVNVGENGKAIPTFPLSTKVNNRRESSRPVELVRVENCGKAPLAPSELDDNVKIVGGEDAEPYEYPWQAALLIDILYFCGGSLISNEWVMTAGHCLNDANDVKVVLGINNLNVSEPNQEHFDSKDFFVHEDYNPTLIHNDIAMIRLPRQVTFNDYIQPVCLPTLPELPTGTIVTATGWGKTKDGIFAGVSDVLEKVDVPVADNTLCSEYYSAIIINENILCVDTTGGHGPCNGDSGGPLNYVNEAGATEARGITSFGSSEGCQSGAPGAFTRVSHFTEWIANKTGVTF